MSTSSENNPNTHSDGEILEYRKLKYSAELRLVKTNDSDLSYLGLENIESYTGRYVETDTIPSEGEAVLYTDKDVLFNKLRPYLSKVFFPLSTGRCTGELLVLRPSFYHRRFLYYLLLNQDFIKDVDSSTFGSKMPRANWEYIGNRRLPVPKLPHQQLISAFLDRETSRIDALISKKQRQIELLQKKRQAIITRAVTKGLNPNANMKDSGVEWIGEIPERWDVLKFSRCVSISEGQVDPELPEYSSMLLIAPNHIESNTGRLISQETAEEQGAESGKYCCQRGDVVYSKIRPHLAKAAIAPDDGLCSADMYPMKGRNGLLTDYLLWILISDAFTSWAVLKSERVAMPKLNRETMNDFLLPIPPQEEQTSMVRLLKDVSTKTDDLIGCIRKSISLLQEYRSSLITAAVSGQIDVSKISNGAKAHAPL